MKKLIIKILRLFGILLGDTIYLKIIFKYRLKRKLNLREPMYFNDKIQWLKINNRNPEHTKLVDKYQVREFIKERIGEGYLNELYGVYENSFDIDQSKLPEEFIIKLNHGSRFNLIVNKGEKLSKKQLKIINKWKSNKYYIKNRERVYKDVIPKIIIEKLLHDKKYNQIIDYKFHCFHGKANYIQINYKIKNKEIKKIYDLDWNMLDIIWLSESSDLLEIDKPEKLNDMISLAEIISRDLIYSRVDFYYIENKIIFGEITFYPGSGTTRIKPLSFERHLGELIDLNLGDLT